MIVAIDDGFEVHMQFPDYKAKNMLREFQFTWVPETRSWFLPVENSAIKTVLEFLLEVGGFTLAENSIEAFKQCQDAPPLKIYAKHHLIDFDDQGYIIRFNETDNKMYSMLLLKGFTWDSVHKGLRPQLSNRIRHIRKAMHALSKTESFELSDRARQELEV